MPCCRWPEPKMGKVPTTVNLLVFNPYDDKIEPLNLHPSYWSDVEISSAIPNWTGWWFGTMFYIFPSVGNFIIQTDKLIRWWVFFQPPTSHDISMINCNPMIPMIFIQDVYHIPHDVCIMLPPPRGGHDSLAIGRCSRSSRPRGWTTPPCAKPWRDQWPSSATCRVPIPQWH